MDKELREKLEYYRDHKGQFDLFILRDEETGERITYKVAIKRCIKNYYRNRRNNDN